MSHVHLNVQERIAIFYLRQMRLSFRAIGRRLDRDHTTISREYRRNRLPHAIYWYGTAQALAEGSVQNLSHFRFRPSRRSS